MTLYEMKEIEREAGRKEGEINGLAGLVHDRDLSFEIAARRARSKYGITEEAFREMVDTYSSEDNEVMP